MALNMTGKEIEKSWNPTRFLLTGRSGGSDQTLPPSVRSIPERSKPPRITTGRIRSQLTGRSQSLVQPVSIVFARSDAEQPSDRTLNSRVRSLLHSRFTSCELTGRWTLESGAVSGHSFSSKSSKFFVLPISNQVPTSIRSK